MTAAMTGTLHVFGQLHAKVVNWQYWLSAPNCCSLRCKGMKKGLVSDRKKGIWPQNIWAVSDDDIPLEAQLENPEAGTYHGYPMPDSDPFAAKVLDHWKKTP